MIVLVGIFQGEYDLNQRIKTLAIRELEVVPDLEADSITAGVEL